MSNKDQKFYLPPSDFFAEVIRSKQKGEVTEELGKMFLLLAEKVAHHNNWNRYNHIKDDLISENVFACMKGFAGFEPYQRSTGKVWDGEDVEYHFESCNNPHAWFTTCCFNNLKQFMKREYKQSNINNKMRVECGLDPSFGYTDMLKEQEDAQNQMDDEYEEEQTED